MTTHRRMIIVNHEGLLVDPVTGLVIDDAPIDYGPEWRSYNEEERTARSRVGSPLTEIMHDNGVHTFIEPREGFEDLRRLHMKIVGRSRRLIELLRLLYRVCINEGLLGRICEDAAWALKVIWRRTRTRGYAAIRASLMYALGVHGHPLFAKYNSWGSQRVLRKAGIYFKVNETLLINNYVRYVITRLDIPSIAELYAMKTYKSYIEKTSTSPRAKAAASVYVAAKLADANVTMKLVGGIIGVTDAAIRYTIRMTGIRVQYLLDGALLEEWYSGKDSIGLRSPRYIASMYGVSRYTFNVHIPTSNKEPIKVVIYEQ